MSAPFKTVSAELILKHFIAENLQWIPPYHAKLLRRVYIHGFLRLCGKSVALKCFSTQIDASSNPESFGCPSLCCLARLFVYLCDHHTIWQRSGPLWECRGMFVFVLHILKRLFVSLLEGPWGKKKGKVRCVRELFELSGLALGAFLWSSCKKQSRVIGKKEGVGDLAIRGCTLRSKEFHFLWKKLLKSGRRDICQGLCKRKACFLTSGEQDLKSRASHQHAVLTHFTIGYCTCVACWNFDHVLINCAALITI